MLVFLATAATTMPLWTLAAPKAAVFVNPASISLPWCVIFLLFYDLFIDCFLINNISFHAFILRCAATISRSSSDR